MRNRFCKSSPKRREQVKRRTPTARTCQVAAAWHNIGVRAWILLLTRPKRSFTVNTGYARQAATVKAELRRMLDLGCSFADARLYDEDRSERLTLYDGNLETNHDANERGIGLRTLYQGAWGFAATADLGSIPACFDRALANAQAATLLPGFPKDMGSAQPVKGQYRPPVAKDPFEVPTAEKLALLSGIDARLKQPLVSHRYVTGSFQRRKILYWNSEGTEVDRWQLNTFGSLVVMAPDAQGRTQRRSLELRGTGDGTRGWEWLADAGSFGGHAERLCRELSEIVAAEPLAPGRRDVILLPGQGFLQVHETIGHALELDRILGYELS
ncbi:hypothetical protein FJY70_02590, partial [candidate division WOR-3 bacterium]|nr:hypothetical protein [candidate division WOR-3 bacterium]